MADSLTGDSPSETYLSLLKAGNGNEGITASLAPIADGKGQESIIRVSTTECNIGNQVSITNDTCEINELTITGWINSGSTINIKAFGATGDGSTDDTVAIQNAINALTSCSSLYFPAGEYLITNTLNLKWGDYYGDSGSVLKFSGMSGKNGFNAPTSVSEYDATLTFRNLKIFLDGQNGENFISTTVNSTFYTQYRVRYLFENLTFGNKSTAAAGFKIDYAWKNIFNIGDCAFCLIDNISAYGNYDITISDSGQFESRFLYSYPNSACLDLIISNVFCACYRKFASFGKVFIKIREVDIARSWIGIEDGSFSEIIISNTAINAQKYGINFSGINYISCTNCQVNRHKNGYDHSEEWAGIFLENTDKCDFYGTKVQIDTSITLFPNAIDLIGFKIINNSGSNSILSTTISSGIKKGFLLDDVDGMLIDNTIIASASANLTVFNFTGTTNQIEVGSYTAPGSFLGLLTSYNLDVSTQRRTITLRNEVVSFTPILDFVTVSYTTQTGRAIRDGQKVYFEIFIDYTSLNTADTSQITVGLNNIPWGLRNQGFGIVNTNLILSTGFNFASNDFVSSSFESTGNQIKFCNSDGTKYTYNSGKIDASGKIYISGYYLTYL